MGQSTEAREGIRVLLLVVGEQRLGLFAKVFEVGTGREIGNPFHAARGPLIGQKEVRARTSKREVG